MAGEGSWLLRQFGGGWAAACGDGGRPVSSLLLVGWPPSPQADTRTSLLPPMWPTAAPCLAPPDPPPLSPPPNTHSHTFTYTPSLCKQVCSATVSQTSALIQPLHLTPPPLPPPLPPPPPCTGALCHHEPGVWLGQGADQEDLVLWPGHHGPQHPGGRDQGSAVPE